MAGIKVDSEKLREAKEDAFLSQAEIAEKAGVSLDTVYRMEGGIGTFHVRSVRQVAEALGVDPKFLVVRDEGKVLAR